MGVSGYIIKDSCEEKELWKAYSKSYWSINIKGIYHFPKILTQEKKMGTQIKTKWVHETYGINTKLVHEKYMYYKR